MAALATQVVNAAAQANTTCFMEVPYFDGLKSKTHPLERLQFKCGIGWRV
jgi:hypothetical protein